MKVSNKTLIAVGLGIIGLAYIYGRKKELVIKKDIYVLPEKFKNDVDKMSKDEIQKAIEENKRYLENATILPDTRRAIEKMLEYLKSKA